MVNVYDPRSHHIIETEQTRFLRREMKMQDIFTVRNREADNWTVCVWVNRALGEFRELKILRDIRDLDKRAVWDLLLWANKKTSSISEIRKERALEKKRELRRWDEQNKEALEAKKFTGRWMKKKFGNIVGENPEWDRPGLPVSFGA